MRRVWNVILGTACCLAFVACAVGQGNPRGTASLSIGGGKVSVEYGRPSLHGGTVEDRLGQLPVGGFWRLGADKTTTFSTSVALDFGGVTVPKGEYSLWVQKDSDSSYKLVFNKQHGQWGAGPGAHDSSKDLASIPLKQEKEKSAEMVTIGLETENGGGEISIQWGDMELTAPFKTK